LPVYSSARFFAELVGKSIYERSSIELIGHGVGIFATHLELLEALGKCGASTVDIGVIVYKRITFGKVIAVRLGAEMVCCCTRFTSRALELTRLDNGKGQHESRQGTRLWQ
jgi:hypothetical protein